MDDDKLDLTPLDPTRDQLGWERRIAAVAARGLAARQRSLAEPLTVSRQISAWRKPALGLAVALAAASWLAVIAGERASNGARAQESAEMTWARWASNDQVPQTSEVFALMEASSDR